MTEPMVGPLPYPALPEQPTFTTWHIQWSAYDVPRLWDIVRVENDQLGWEQVNGFRQLSDLLVDQYRRLRTQWTNLSAAWQGGAADVYLSRLDAFSIGLLADAQCAGTTANALHSIMSTYANARMRIGTIVEHWNHVTSDWVPEWWDQAAAELNAEAAQVMLETDMAVRDHRTRIIIPAEVWSARDSSSAAQLDQTTGESGNLAPPVPALPGYAPTAGEIQPSAHSDAELASMPTPVVVAPGQPVSVLPIPPGSPYAPHGGAYVLPGPGVGEGGYVVRMVPSAGTGGERWSAAATTDGRGSGSGGMLPMPMTSPNGKDKDSNSPIYRRRSQYVWHIEKGVPPVIEPVADDAVIPNRPSARQEEAFREWFAELAYPWRSGSDDSQPLVVLRKVPT